MKSQSHGMPGAFTLVELMIVTGLIALVLTIALPIMTAALRSGADKQAENLVAGYFTGARALAVREGQYVCVHHQVGTGTFANACYIGIFLRDANTGLFRRAPGYDIQPLPVGMCLGEISPNTVSGGNYIAAAGTPDQFTCFSVVFSPSGKVVSNVEGGLVRFDTSRAPFQSTDRDTYIWNGTTANAGTNGEAGASAVTLFQYAQYLARPTGTGAGTRVAYLNESGQFLPVNVHTGQLYVRK